MKCPHCNNDIRLPDYAWNNATIRRRIDSVLDGWLNDSYRVTTLCCHNIVALAPYISVKVTKAADHSRCGCKSCLGENGPVDDWGVPAVGKVNAKATEGE